MSHRYMLDTNVISQLMREPDGAISQRMEAVGVERLCCSVVVAAELRYGAVKRGSEKLTQRVNAALNALTVLPFSMPADAVYASIRAELAAAGTPIGPNDLFIAAHAVSESMVLVTNNVDEFSRIAILTIENWQVP